jgi:GNAT superfamily N-acetyltransferase
MPDEPAPAPAPAPAPSIDYRVRPDLTSARLNALFTAGSPTSGWPPWQKTPDTSDWAPVLARSLTWVCAFAGDELVGFVNVAWDGRDHAFLLDTRVHPDLRHQGIGVQLVRRAAGAARREGCTVLHVDYDEQLTPFYEACGFRPTAAGLLPLD